MPRVASQAGHGGRQEEHVYDSAFAAVGDLATLRADVREQLFAFGRSPGHVRAVALVLSELATNALRHGSPPYHLSVDLTERDTVVEVSDADDAHVLPRAPAEGGGGYGLHLIDAIAVRWDARAAGGVKCVRATIAETSGL
jgi:two-component sensor histidine kinase